MFYDFNIFFVKLLTCFINKAFVKIININKKFDNTNELVVKTNKQFVKANKITINKILY